MEVTGKRTIYEGRFVRIVEKHVVTSDGSTRAWETIERSNIHGHGAVVIIARTTGGELLFEKNWRAPIESYVIQFPAGLTDLDGESEEEAARRELLEETGYAAGEMIPLMLSPLSAALTPTRAMHYFAPDVECVGTPSGTDVEEIEVVKVPISQVDEFMLNLPPDVELDLRVPGILWFLRQKRLI
jgi:ADP-ribose pyrophosphatase